MQDPAELAAENHQVLMLGQAMFGNVSPNMRAVSLEYSAARVHLHFLLAEEDAEDREEIDEIVFQFEAYQEVMPDVDVSLVVSADPMAIGQMPGRFVYIRRERVTSSLEGGSPPGASG